jgi:hypothetical protein
MLLVLKSLHRLPFIELYQSQYVYSLKLPLLDIDIWSAIAIALLVPVKAYQNRRKNSLRSYLNK